MSAFLGFLAWEWINIALEFAATAWVRLPRWFLAVVGVNLLTHPLFTIVLGVFGRSVIVILPCEAIIVCVEAFSLMAIYGFDKWQRLLAVSLIMNVSSYLTGVFIVL